jgi:hypothetical protein
LAEHVAPVGKKRNAYMLVEKTERKITLGKQRRRYVDNIKMDFEEVGWGCLKWIGLAQDRDKWRAVANAVMNLRVP